MNGSVGDRISGCARGEYPALSRRGPRRSRHRGGSIIELAIRAANQAERLTGFLKPFFEFLTVVFGVLSALVAAMFVIRQFRLMSERSPKD
jgi:hypothetical protein